MAGNNFDYAISNLLCTETDSLFFDNLDSMTTDDQIHQTYNQKLGFNDDRSEPLIDLPLQTEESFYSMVEREREHLPKNDYLKRLRSGDLNLDLRREALDWIWKLTDLGIGEVSGTHPPASSRDKVTAYGGAWTWSTGLYEENYFLPVQLAPSVGRTDKNKKPLD
ncbi:hypothetical protein HYC85_017408 [Camellia sinensis]|uniref:Uncharacterized protein n=1 Tax=Camellia sinensis TaxID=4442 RepID=A0A7J7GTT8_CAMSI|nr:hypothetical protein HYC85_017408 [Camellia sinensis]